MLNHQVIDAYITLYHQVGPNKSQKLRENKWILHTAHTPDKGSYMNQFFLYLNNQKYKMFHKYTSLELLGMGTIKIFSSFESIGPLGRCFL